MALIYIMGPRGYGKTISTIVNPDGSISEIKDGKPVDYQGMDPKSTLILDYDGKGLSFSPKYGFNKEARNVITDSIDKKSVSSSLLKKDKSKNNMNPLQLLNANKNLKAIVIDTISTLMHNEELIGMRGANDKRGEWMKFAENWFEIIKILQSNRPDLNTYILGHTEVFKNKDGYDCEKLQVNGKKLEKIGLEGQTNIVLYANCEHGGDGSNEYWFETQSSGSTARTPFGMFKDFKIPNSMALVDKTIREYYETN